MRSPLSRSSRASSPGKYPMRLREATVEAGAAFLLREVFGSEYGEGAAAFQLLLVSTGFILFRVPMHNLFLVRRELRLEMGIMAAAVVLNVVLNAWLIPRYDIVGAAWATLAAEFAALAAGAVCVHRWGLRVTGARFARVLVAAVVMTGAVFAIRDTVHVLVAVLAGVLVYGALLAALGGIPRDVRTYVAGLRRD